jgi:hypothetical protein
VMVFYEFIGDRYDVISATQETYILQRPSKVFICHTQKS